MTIQIKQTIETQKEIELPLFFSDGYTQYAFFEDRMLYTFGCAKHLSISDRPLDKADLIRCFDASNPISEAEFMEHWEAALKSMSLIPTLKLETV